MVKCKFCGDPHDVKDCAGWAAEDLEMTLDQERRDEAAGIYPPSVWDELDMNPDGSDM